MHNKGTMLVGGAQAKATILATQDNNVTFKAALHFYNGTHY